MKLEDVVENFFNELFYSRNQVAKVEEIIQKVHSLKDKRGKELSSKSKALILRTLKYRYRNVKPILKEADNTKHLATLNNAQNLIDKIKERLEQEANSIEAEQSEKHE